jgi:carbamoyltransferase
MNILSITNHYESSAAIYSNGIVRAASEERFSREKNQGGMPERTIAWLLDSFSLSLGGIDQIVFCTCSSIYPEESKLQRLIEEICSAGSDYERKVFLHRFQTEVVYNSKAIELFEGWCRRNSISQSKVRYLDHHEAHARSVANFYDLDEGIIFTCDGKGGFTSSAVWDLKDRDIRQRSFNSSINSLGYMYGNFTIQLGFQAERHEGKLVGLAAFADPPDGYKSLNPFYVEDGLIYCRNIHGRYIPFFDRVSQTWMNLQQLRDKVAEWSREQTASAAQAILEEVILDWISQNLTASTKNILLSGGVFANVKLNQRIFEKFASQKIFVNPPMGDTGLCIGGLPSHGIKSLYSSGMYLGPSYDEEATKLLESDNKFHCSELCGIDEVAACLETMFSKGSPVGIFHGPMEFGPRALCHRSIIFKATDRESNLWLNDRMNRTEFMPFAPVVIDRDAERFFIGYDPSLVSAEFMTITFDCTQVFKDLAPAVVHVDGTARPQILHRDRDPWFYDVLQAYLARTGEACLMNTSFNNHEEPIVCKPEDALKSLERRNVDAIIFAGRFLVELKK